MPKTKCLILKNKSKERQMQATLIAWVSERNQVKIIKGKDLEDLEKIAKSFLEQVAPKGEKVKSALWRNGKVISSINFVNKSK